MRELVASRSRRRQPSGNDRFMSELRPPYFTLDWFRYSSTSLYIAASGR